jgi:hypothetical protein
VKVVGHERDGVGVTLIASMSVFCVSAVVMVMDRLFASFVLCRVFVLDSLSDCGVFFFPCRRHGIVGLVCLFLFYPYRLCSQTFSYDREVSQSACLCYRGVSCHLYLLHPL